MATNSLHRLQQQTNAWSTIFPNEQVTQQQSALFVKKLLAVAISNITYLRTIFPEHAFGDRCLEDLNLKILRDDSACPGACQVIQWVKGCFDALDKKYLRSIVIGIYEDSNNPHAVVETYTFKFGYNKDQGVVIFHNGNKLTSAYNEAETRKATIKLLRTIIVLTQTLKPLPDDVMMTMKLYYYDSVTPADYEPPGFQSAALSDFSFHDDPLSIKVGDVKTPFHTVKLRIRTECQQFSICEERKAGVMEEEGELEEEEEEEEKEKQEKKGKRKKEEKEKEELRGGKKEKGEREKKRDVEEERGRKQKEEEERGSSKDEGDETRMEVEGEKGRREAKGREGKRRRSERQMNGGGKVQRAPLITEAEMEMNDVEREEEKKRRTYEHRTKEASKAATGDFQSMAKEPTLKATAQFPHPPSSSPPHHKHAITTHTSLSSNTLSVEEEKERCQERERDQEMEEELLEEEEKEEEEEVGNEGEEEEENIVRCPCGCNEDDGLMVLCAECQVWQHAVCFALLYEDQVPETHICVSCSQFGNLRCTDALLQTLNAVAVQATCLWRRALLASVEFNRVVAHIFSRRLGVEVSVAQGLINRLEKEGFVRCAIKNKRLGKIVNKDQVKNIGIRKYFTEVHKDALGLATSTSTSDGKVSVVREQERKESRRSPRTVARRVRATVDESVEFDISCSLDPEAGDELSEPRCKKRKTSIASRSILV